MTQKNAKIFINEMYSKAPNTFYPTNKTDVYQIDDIWSLDLLDVKDYGAENNRGYRYVLVNTGILNKFGGTLFLKNKNAQTLKNIFEKKYFKFKMKTKINRNRSW